MAIFLTYSNPVEHFYTKRMVGRPAHMQLKCRRRDLA